MNIYELLKKRENYALKPGNIDEWYEEILKDDDKEQIEFICTKGFFLFDKIKRREKTKKLLSNYNISAMIDLANPYYETSIQFQLVIFTKKQIKNIKISNYNAKVKIKSKREYLNKFGIVSFAAEADNDFNKYIKDAQKWLDTGIKEENKNYEFTEINSNQLKEIICSAYTAKKLKMIETLEKSKTIELEEVADIITTSNNDKMERKTLFNKDMVYPLQESEIKYTDKYKTKIKKGDILLSRVGSQKVYLVDKDVKDLYASSNIIVIRCKTISPEYLYIYLTSDLVKEYILNVRKGCIISYITIETVKKLPVVEPKFENQEYIKLFKGKVYKYEDLEEYYEIIEDTPTEINNVDCVLKAELIEKIKEYKNTEAIKLIENDMKELNVCYNAKAYKAVLIMAGSILEALLIDWVSDKKGIDYFATQLKIEGHNGKKKKAELYDYIDIIKQIEEPEWMEEYKKANEIRKKRNLVHARLCLENEGIINKETCKIIIDYLKDIIDSRVQDIKINNVIND